jgi:tryptophan synthase alpha subunit
VEKVGLKAAFIFVAPEADAARDRAVVDSPVVRLTVVGVKDYKMGVKAAVELVDQGIEAIELCAGFGVEGAAMVKQALQGKVPVGVVRFDNHPGFDFKSGDELFK